MSNDLFGDMGISEQERETLMQYIVEGEFERGIKHLRGLNNKDLAHQILRAGFGLISIKHHGRKAVIDNVVEQIKKSYIEKSDQRLFHINAKYESESVSGCWARMTSYPMMLHKCRVMASKFNKKYTVQFERVMD